MSLTTDPNDSRLNQPRRDGNQNEAYLVLTEEERAKGFVRPVRTSYIHVGKTVELEGELESLDLHPNEYYTEATGYVAFLKYPESRSPLVGKYLTRAGLNAFIEKQNTVGGCKTVTTMNRTIAETYAREPKFYGATFCCGCNKHLPVDEFVWDGTDERVGS